MVPLDRAPGKPDGNKAEPAVAFAAPDPTAPAPTVPAPDATAASAAGTAPEAVERCSWLAAHASWWGFAARQLVADGGTIDGFSARPRCRLAGAGVRS